MVEKRKAKKKKRNQKAGSDNDIFFNFAHIFLFTAASTQFDDFRLSDENERNVNPLQTKKKKN